RTGRIQYTVSKVTMEPYSNEEYANMHFMYGRANGNAREAARLVHQRLKENGGFTHGRAFTLETKLTSLTGYLLKGGLKKVLDELLAVETLDKDTHFVT
ncbi:hypothetical protein L9F63_022697, partial [Diploptera punctata]